MTVKQLIEALNNVDPTLEIRVSSDGLTYRDAECAFVTEWHSADGDAAMVLKIETSREDKD